MNISLIFDIIKTLLAKDTSPEEINKPIYLKRRYIGLVLVVIGSVAYTKYGLVIDKDTLSTLQDNYEVIVNSVVALISALSAVWGVFVSVRGQIGHTKKINAVLDTCKAEVDYKKEPSTPKNDTNLPESPRINE